MMRQVFLEIEGVVNENEKKKEAASDPNLKR